LSAAALVTWKNGYAHPAAPRGQLRAWTGSARVVRFDLSHPTMKLLLPRLLLLALSVPFAASAAERFSPEKVESKATDLDSALLAKIPARMQEFVDQGKAAGIVTLVIRHGHTASLQAVGYQDREAKTPMRADTLFQIMSITKPMTCAALMTLVDDGRVALIDPVEKYLPEFKDVTLAREAASTTAAAGTTVDTPLKPSRPITLLDLMTHTSGVVNTMPRDFKRGEHTLAEQAEAVAKIPLQFEPGSKWRYSSMGMVILGRIIEVVSGKPYEQFMQERILTPLEMKNTWFFLPADQESRLAAAYTDKNGTLVRFEGDRFHRGAKAPMPDAGLYSTATDVSRFFQMMLNHGVLNGRRILSPAAVETMTTVQTGDLKTGFFPGAGFGLGLAVVHEPIGTYRYNSLGSYGHGGGFRTYGWVDPSKDLVGVFMCQRTNGGGDIADEMNAFMALAAASITVRN
jgi:CubicO group peptidase (beta-lactamase class C family)